MRKTKIICTIGPASEKREILSQIIEAGMNVSRHNFSHGDHEEHAVRIKPQRNPKPSVFFNAHPRFLK